MKDKNCKIDKKILSKQSYIIFGKVIKSEKSIKLLILLDRGMVLEMNQRGSLKIMAVYWSLSISTYSKLLNWSFMWHKSVDLTNNAVINSPSLFSRKINEL